MTRKDFTPKKLQKFASETMAEALSAAEDIAWKDVASKDTAVFMLMQIGMAARTTSLSKQQAVELLLFLGIHLLLEDSEGPVGLPALVAQLSRSCEDYALMRQQKATVYSTIIKGPNLTPSGTPVH